MSGLPLEIVPRGAKGIFVEGRGGGGGRSHVSMCLSCTKDMLPKGTSIECTLGTFLGTVLTTVNNKCYFLGSCWNAICVLAVNTVCTLIFVWFYIHSLCRLKAFQKSLHLQKFEIWLLCND